MRTRGAKNADFEASKSAIVRTVAGFVISTPGPHSFRSLAAASGLNTGTVRHYFGDAAGLIREVLKQLHSNAEPFLRKAKQDVPADAHEACLQFLMSVVFAWRQGLGAIHQLGMLYGLSNKDFGPSYLELVLEPTLATAEVRFASLVERGVILPTDVRAAALSLVAPVVLALMHQDAFGGGAVHPLDVVAFAKQHAAWMATALLNRSHQTLERGNV